MRRFVIVVDTQRDFMAADGALAVAGAAALVEPMAAWLGALKPGETAGVLFTFDTHEPDIYAASPEAAQFPPHCVRGTPGWDNLLGADMLDAAIPAWRLEKGVFAMWAEPGLTIAPMRGDGAPIARDAFFAGLLAAGIAEAEVIGVAADYCVRYAIEGLVERGFRVRVPAALTRGIERQIEAVAAAFADGRVLVI